MSDGRCDIEIGIEFVVCTFGSKWEIVVEIGEGGELDGIVVLLVA